MGEQAWVPLEGPALLAGVRDILVENPERHNQSLWVGNVYLDAEDDITEGMAVPVDEIRVYMNQPVTVDPAAVAEVPPCGTTGCAMGWGAILSAPSGSLVSNGRLYLPGGESYYMPEWVGPRMGFSAGEASFVFSPSRTREELIDILNARIADPRVNIISIVYPGA